MEVYKDTFKKRSLRVQPKNGCKMRSVTEISSRTELVFFLLFNPFMSKKEEMKQVIKETWNIKRQETNRSIFIYCFHRNHLVVKNTFQYHLLNCTTEATSTF